MIRSAIESGGSSNAGGAKVRGTTILRWLAGSLLAPEIWRRRHKSSMQFARVEANLLRDLGISEAQRFIEVNKPFWEK